MQFTPSMGDKQLAAAITRLLAIGTSKAWEHRAANFESEVQSNPFMADYVAERHTIEMAMAQVQRRKRLTGRSPNILKVDLRSHRLFAFAAMFTRVHDRLSGAARRALVGRLRSGLKEESGLMPLAFELLIAAHLMQMGADVEWHDLESGGGFDFLVRRNGAEAEVECKTFSADVGRKVHQKRVYQLGGMVKNDLDARLDARGSYFSEVVVEGQFVGKALDDVSSALKSALQRHDVAGTPSVRSVAVHDLSPSELPARLQSGTFTENDIVDFVAKRFGLHNQSLLAKFKRGKGLAIAAVRSSNPDDVVDEMYRQLKRGTRQFSGTRPGILCAHFLDLTPDQIMNLYYAQKRKQPSGFNGIATRLFGGGRAFLLSTHFSSPGRLESKQELKGSVLRHNLRETGPTYNFVNPKHVDATNKDLQLF